MRVPRRYSPPVVQDWVALGGRLDEILASRGRSDSTAAGYASALKWWTTFCAEHGVEPWAASFDVWEKAVAAGRHASGNRYTWDWYTLIVRAVADRHHDMRIPVPAPRQPQHAGVWDDIGETYRANLNTKWAKDRTVYTRDPLTRGDINALLSVAITDLSEKSTSPQCGRGGGSRRVAQRLVLLDTGCSANQLAKLLPEHVGVGADGVRLEVGEDQFFLSHDDAQRVFGVPWDCSACAVVERLADLAATPGQPLFNGRGARELTSQWPGLMASTSKLLEQPGLTVRERAGLRRGLTLAAHRPKEWPWFLVGRAWVALAWEAGFRMSGDLVGLDRSWCSPLPSGDGFRIQLHATKDDQQGKKHVSRPFRFDPEGGPSAALMLTEYLAVRDARLGSEGPLLWWGGRAAAKRAPRTCVWAAQRSVVTLAEAARVGGTFTSYSPRKGYSVQSAADGRSPELRQRGLRHDSVRTTLNHYPDGADSAATIETMMNRLVEQLGAGP